MSIRLMSEVWSSQLKTCEKLMMLALSDGANEDGFCRPDQNKLADLCSIPREKVSLYLSELEDSGWLKVIGSGWLQVIIKRGSLP